ncbi:FHA domain-containing protein [Curtobacterium sp. MCBD17_026]|uniref:FHA domain-containing protein n=1 Tax=Curtobacterium sp. MCBD17_026 TaxID=2175621 RepID=UPI0015E8C3E8|nr:FHA domain-containing protein [Curtobacterium sp. MCBD17_026]WIB72616.1 FHA domain-containing protein [Curtobacterium sp. MCBD17_026]
MTLNPNGTGTVSLPGRSVAIEATNLRDARERAIRVLTEHAASSSMSIDVVALDAGETVMLTVTTDGRVSVNTTVNNGLYRNSTGDVMPLEAGDAAAFAADAPASSAPAGPPTVVPTDTTTAVPTAAAPVPADTTTAVPPQSQASVPTLQPHIDPTPHGDDSEAGSVGELAAGLEATIVRGATPPERPKAELTFSTGDFAKITGTALIGRHPRIGDNEQVDQVVMIEDDTRSLSRTHCLVSWQDGVFWILDRNSGNGTSVERDGTTVSLDPSTAHILNDGDKVLIGDHSFTVALTGAVNARD